MNKPLSITLISLAFIMAGTIGIIYHAPELKEFTENPQIILVLVIRVLAIVGGYYVLRGAGWARWLLVAWMVYHVILSFYHDLMQLITHIVFLAILIAGLFHAKANAYFKKTK